jgi:hypothetical protein
VERFAEGLNNRGVDEEEPAGVGEWQDWTAQSVRYPSKVDETHCGFGDVHFVAMYSFSFVSLSVSLMRRPMISSDLPYPYASLLMSGLAHF